MESMDHMYVAVDRCLSDTALLVGSGGGPQRTAEDCIDSRSRRGSCGFVRPNAGACIVVGVSDSNSMRARADPRRQVAKALREALAPCLDSRSEPGLDKSQQELADLLIVLDDLPDKAFDRLDASDPPSFVLKWARAQMVRRAAGTAGA